MRPPRLILVFLLRSLPLDLYPAPNARTKLGVSITVGPCQKLFLEPHLDLHQYLGNSHGDEYHGVWQRKENAQQRDAHPEKDRVSRETEQTRFYQISLVGRI